VLGDALLHRVVDGIRRVVAVLVDEAGLAVLRKLVLAIGVRGRERRDYLAASLLGAGAHRVLRAVLLVERLLAERRPLLSALLGGEAVHLTRLGCRRARGQSQERGGNNHPSNGIP